MNMAVLAILIGGAILWYGISKWTNKNFREWDERMMGKR
jgi:hypothetical protein